MSECGYALLEYASGNLGDEIQAVAARQYLPRVDAYVHRGRLDRDPGGDFARYKLILNGFFMSEPVRWPPHPRYDPLLISMHITPALPRRHFYRRPPSELMLRPEHHAYWRSHGRVGARDAETFALFQENRLDAYLSGCLTLTLPPAIGARGDDVIANDLDREVVATLKRAAGDKLRITSHGRDLAKGRDARMVQAEEMIGIYARARCVVTSRLHCAMPCLALGTPVLLVRPPEKVMNRFAGLLPLLRHCSREELLVGAVAFDVHNPPPNKDDYLAFRHLLAARCLAFVAG